MGSSSSVSIPIITIIFIVISTLSNGISASDLTQSMKSSKDHANKLQSTSESTNNDNNEQRCEKITIPMCMDIGYNYTSMPNLLEMDTQEEAGLEVHQFWPLVEINCSDDLKFFLCSMYVPICIEEYSGHIPSCKSVCERAREGCKPIMIQYGFPWPDKMNCSELPVYGDSQHICMDPKKGTGVEMDTNGSNNNNNDNNNFNDVQFVDKFNNHNNKANNNNHNHHHMSNNNNNKAKVKNNSNNNNNNFNGNKNHQLSSYSTTYSTNYYYPSATDNNNNNNNVMIFDPYNDVNNNNGNNNNNKLPTLINNNEMVMRTQSPINNDMNMISNHNNYNECRCDCRVPYFIRLKSPSSTQTFDDQQKQQQSPQHSSHYHHYNSYQSIHHFNHSKIETASGLAPMCALSCKGAFHFNEDEQETSFFWIGITAAICAITCILTVFTSLTDTERFRYPERAIIFLAACYIFIAGGYLLRIRLGHNAIACDGPFIRYQRTGPTPASCILSFILLYFFGMASAYWWLILTLTWFLAAGLKWSSEAITSYAQYFHLLAWLLPTAQSLTILCLGAIDGDPFMGVCSVGNQSRANLLIFVITPLCVCITIGIMFLITGFVALFRIRRAIRQTQHTIRVKTDKLEKLMIRIGLSSFLYIVPEVVVVACHIYEYIYRPLWEKSLTCLCKDNNEQYTPQFSIIVMKYVMSLIIGITSSFWIWSGKTLESWMRIYTKISCCASPFGSPNSSRSSGTSQLLPNLGNYYGRGMTVLNGGSSAPIKTQSVVNQLGSTISQPNTPHHHSIHVHHQHHDLQSRQTQSIILPPTRPPSIPPPLPPPPPSMMAAMTTGNHSHHHHHNQQQNLLHHHHHHGGSGSLNGSQFSHLIGSINAINSTTNNNNKHPLSHV